MPEDPTAPETDSVLIMLTVPHHWRVLSVAEIERSLRLLRKDIFPMLAQEIKRWQGTDVIDTAALRDLVDAVEANQDKGEGFD